ncbi:SDR family NAD(P)-dependent oxidoreductase [Paracoccus sp. 11-3]|uniref:SDR family NAD(P)-dependent oxidoreductase n=1 Tax=Paracoccus amoyensis TaxID=2760093 RepID=A0A926GPF3_9RHOB|nr:SDR family NAD(P)-dependent oxidoreductase [Paracoccus amoyensis]MBC9247565.1 SDR family NAD(P)-dependent oxidoreductase [Paracoccus amoyensis]
MELEGKSIIITGASSGIGAAAASLFSHEGAQLVLGARRSEKLAEITDAINQGGGRAAFLAGDVRDPAYAQDLVELAVESFGGLDGAFNNAGSVGDMIAVDEMDPENWHDVIATNLTSPLAISGNPRRR